jgi:GNAT superfamily N-acetyltransferase
MGIERGRDLSERSGRGRIAHRFAIRSEPSPRPLVQSERLSVALRRAGLRDLGAIVELRIEFERVTRDSGSMDEADRRSELRSLLGPDLASGLLAAWIAEEGGRAVGQAGLLSRGRVAELLNVYVEPAFRGRGLGTALVEAAIAEARSRGLKKIRLQPTDDGRPIYERSGFVDSGRDMILAL